MKPVLLVVYLVGAVCAAWCLNVPTVSPFTVTVFGVLVLLALLAHWYDRMALTPIGRRGDYGDASVEAMIVAHRYELGWSDVTGGSSIDFAFVSKTGAEAAENDSQRCLR